VGGNHHVCRVGVAAISTNKEITKRRQRERFSNEETKWPTERRGGRLCDYVPK
jgi:hypothetical protein